VLLGVACCCMCRSQKRECDGIEMGRYDAGRTDTERTHSCGSNRRWVGSGSGWVHRGGLAGSSESIGSSESGGWIGRSPGEVEAGWGDAGLRIEGTEN
jgi:hypothetical protein